MSQTLSAPALTLTCKLTKLSRGVCRRHRILPVHAHQSRPAISEDSEQQSEGFKMKREQGECLVTAPPPPLC